MKTFIDDLLEAVANAAANSGEEDPTSQPDTLHNSTSESITSLDNPDLSDSFGNPHLNC